MVLVHTLLCHGHLEHGIPCLRSLVCRASEAIRLIIHDDGSLTETDIETLRGALPVSAVVQRAQADEMLASRAAKYPATMRYRAACPLGIKLVDIMLGDEDETVFCDSDIFFFRSYSDLFSRDTDAGGLFMPDTQNAYAVNPQCLLAVPRLKLARRINSGLFVFPKASYDPELIEWLLTHERLQRCLGKTPQWVEQTCWAALALQTRSRTWDARKVRVIASEEDLELPLVCGHFTSPSRPWLRRYLTAAETNSSALTAGEIVTRRDVERCTAIGLCAEIARRKRRALFGPPKRGREE